MEENIVTCYNRQTDIIGRPVELWEMLLVRFAENLETLNALRNLNQCSGTYKADATRLKKSLQLFSPSAALTSRAAGKVQVAKRTNIMQLDFDYDAIKDFDIETLKQSIFSLPFIGFCGLSCSGKGFYALALIAEPEKLKEYAEHCFRVLLSYGIKADTSKGRNPQDLRYVSFDKNMLIRENPTPLHIKHLRQYADVKMMPTYVSHSSGLKTGETFLKAELKKLQIVQPGARWATVQRVAFTIGGLSNAGYLQNIFETINGNSAFTGEEQKYMKCAQVCFEAGTKSPI